MCFFVEENNVFKQRKAMQGKVEKRNKDVFTFKQFTVKQNQTAMKVGTDGVLLGAWATGGKRILDIGTGTGLIAMMMAQRFKQALIDAIDLNTDAYKQACENVTNSVFASNIRVFCVDFQSFYAKQTQNKTILYDAIVSNPPFFEHSLKNPLQAKAQARHTHELPYEQLCVGVSLLLAPQGTFSCILPTDCLGRFLEEANKTSLHLVKDVAIKTTENKTPKRHLLAFQKQANGVCEQREELLADKFNGRSGWYEELTKDFYL